MSNKKKGGVNTTVLGIGLAMVLPMLALFYYGFDTDQRSVPSVLEKKAAPDFELVDLDGKRWSLEELRGKPIVLNFWSTWCGPCKLEHRFLQQGAVAYPEVKFLGVIYSDSADNCRRYLAKAGTTYEHLVDDQGRVAIDYGVAGVPETYFIDKDGVIAHKQVGPVNDLMLAQLVTPLIREAQ